MENTMPAFFLPQIVIITIWLRVGNDNTVLLT